MIVGALLGISQQEDGTKGLLRSPRLEDSPTLPLIFMSTWPTLLHTQDVRGREKREMRDRLEK